MARQVLNLGTPIRGVDQPGYESRYESFRKTDENFAELYAGIVPVSTKTANYTLVLADAGTEIEMNAATALTLTVPTNALVAFVVRSKIQVRQVGAGAVTIAGFGITFRTPGTLTTRTIWSSLVLTKRGTDEWIAEGDSA